MVSSITWRISITNEVREGDRDGTSARQTKGTGEEKSVSMLFDKGGDRGECGGGEKGEGGVNKGAKDLKPRARVVRM